MGFQGDRFRNAPIGRKLLVITMVTTGLALALAGLGVMTLDSILFRSGMERDLTALASIVGDNSTAALAFNDLRVALENLSALRERPHIVTACLLLNDGAVFAQYTRPKATESCPPPRANDEIESIPAGFSVSHPIMLQGKRSGTLVLLYDRGEVSDRRKFYAGLVVLILVVSSLIALALSSRLRAAIGIPLSRLAQAAASVSGSADYSIRVQKDSDDELGVMVDAFNGMLERIESRDRDLQNARIALETTLTSIGDAVISTDTESRVVFANPVAQSLMGWTKAEIAGKPIEEVFRIVNEFTRQPVESPVQKVLREGAVVGLANHTVLIARDGTEIPIDDSAAPIRYQGRILGVVLVFRDITERRRAQQDAGYLAAIVESSDDAILGKTTEGIIQTWNAGAERLYGYRAEEVIGHSMLELLPDDRKHEESDILERIRAGQRVVHFETVRARKDGSPVDVSLTISPIRNRSGQVVGVSHMARDITEQKKRAEQFRETQKLESLGVLAGGIAHDFNNLLTGILGNASIVLDDLPAGSPHRAPLEAVVSASERAAQLAQQMLAYSGRGRFVLEQIDLSARVREILPLLKASIPATVELRLDLAGNLPLIEADPAQLQQLMMNVIINGAEAIPAGSPGTLTILTRPQQIDESFLRSHTTPTGSELAAGPHVLFEVRDSGAGMDEATVARIFDPFFTTKFMGRGLGLAAVLGIVRGHRGSVEVKSRPGQGTVFRFLFPAAAGARETPPLAKQPEALDLRGDGVILVVDDEEIVRHMAQQALQRYGYTVLLAEEGSCGLDLFRREASRIRCVVLDLTMPVMSGEQTLARMKAAHNDIPIILSSGFDEAQAMERFRGQGVAAFLQKPYKASVLVEKVKLVLDRQARGTRTAF